MPSLVKQKRDSAAVDNRKCWHCRRCGCVKESMVLICGYWFISWKGFFFLLCQKWFETEKRLFETVLKQYVERSVPLLLLKIDYAIFHIFTDGTRNANDHTNIYVYIFPFCRLIHATWDTFIIYFGYFRVSFSCRSIHLGVLIWLQDSDVGIRVSHSIQFLSFMIRS